MAAEGYMIEKTAYGSADYEGLRDLWHAVFGDDPAYIDAFYENFGSSIAGYVVKDAAGGVCSALSCHPCGTFDGRQVYVSYAVCTREDMRGQGLASLLVSHVRDEVTDAGGISLVSPAEPHLEDFYGGLGYEPCFFAYEKAVLPDCAEEEPEDCSEYDLDLGRDGEEPPVPASDIHNITAAVYNKYREAFLAERPHIKLNGPMLRLIENESMDGCGLYVINRGDAIFTLDSADAERTVLSELIIAPALAERSGEMDEELAALIADRCGSAEAVYRMPGKGYCQSMAAGMDTGKADHDTPYYGFPVD